MIQLDTGICAPEDLETLLIQQAQLGTGRRFVQMFPLGTIELSLPNWAKRHENFRGIFHYIPSKITPAEIDFASSRGRENEFLNLGPYNKSDIVHRVNAGEKVVCITEYAPNGVEIRAAAGSEGTIDEQLRYFETTKEPTSYIVVGKPPERVFRKGK